MKITINNIHKVQENSAWNLVNAIKVLSITIIIILGGWYLGSYKWVWEHLLCI